LRDTLKGGGLIFVENGKGLVIESTYKSIRGTMVKM
jgi:hypothetical protein